MPPVPKPSRVRSRHFIKAWREHKGVSQEAAAEFLEISRANLSKVERGIVPYSQDLLEKMADLYSCSAGDLIMRDPSDKSAPWSIMDALRLASPEEVARISAIIEALRKAG